MLLLLKCSGLYIPTLKSSDGKVTLCNGANKSRGKHLLSIDRDHKSVEVAVTVGR